MADRPIPDRVPRVRQKAPTRVVEVEERVVVTMERSRDGQRLLVFTVVRRRDDGEAWSGPVLETSQWHQNARGEWHDAGRAGIRAHEVSALREAIAAFEQVIAELGQAPFTLAEGSDGVAK